MSTGMCGNSHFGYALTIEGAMTLEVWESIAKAIEMEDRLTTLAMNKEVAERLISHLRYSSSYAELEHKLKQSDKEKRKK